MVWSQEIVQVTNEVNQLRTSVDNTKTALDNAVAFTESSKNITANNALVAANSAVQTAVSANTAATLKDSVLGVYPTLAAQQSAVVAAQGLAANAVTTSAASSLTLPQDLSGINAAALHRSPNAITAMFVYDTSKDSDGGAWTEKCQHTSWYNETIMGKWLGAQSSERDARHIGATLSNVELVSNGDFSNGLTGWTNRLPLGTISVVNRELYALSGAGNGFTGPEQTITTVVGKTYVATCQARRDSATTVGLTAATISGGNNLGTTTSTDSGNVNLRLVFVATSTTTFIQGYAGTQNGASAFFDNFSVREVISLTAASSDYYQSTADGRFYRLWKNHAQYSEDFANAAWAASSATKTTGVTDPNGGTTATTVTATAANGQILQTVGGSFGTGVSYTNSIWLRRRAGTGVVSLFNPNGAGITSVSVTETWTRFSVTGLGSASNNFIGVRLATSGDAVDVAFGQFEIGSVVTSYEAKTIGGSITEVFRGNKRDFPRLSAIVAEASNVTIYDLTEPGRPMWMRFERRIANTWSSGYFGANTSGNITSLAAQNGILIFGIAAGFGLRVVSFPLDNGYSISNNAGNDRLLNDIITPIAGRNDNITRILRVPSTFLAGELPNAIAMTILPDAPIDPATGLRVPTIAVATGGGISIIRHDGVVRNSSSTSAFNDISIDPYILSASNTSSSTWFYANNPGSLGASFALTSVAGNAAPGFGSQAIGSFERKTRGEYIRRGGARVNMIKHNESTFARSLTSEITNTYNTGWMTGDIRRCYLADSEAGVLRSGVNLVTDLFSPDRVLTLATPWRTVISTAAVTNGILEIRHDHINSPTGRVVSTADLVQVNKTYRCRWTVVGLVGDATGSQISLGSDQSGNGGTSGAIFSGIGSFEAIIQVTPAATGRKITLYAQGGTPTGSVAGIRVSSFSVEEIVSDRSYKAAGASITGSVLRSQLASGTSLVSYSGWSSRNYLQEPYSADLDFGTGEWTASAWVNIPTTLPTSSFPVVGPELVTNGDFSIDSNWIKQTGWSIADGKAIANVSGFLHIVQTILSLTKEKNYSLNFDIIERISGAVAAFLAQSGNGSPNASFGASAVGSYSTILRHPASSSFSGILFRGSPSFIGSIDNISLREVAFAPFFERSFSSGPRIRIGVDIFGFIVAEVFDGVTLRYISTSTAYNTGQWLKVRVNYTTDGTLAIVVNGREVATTRGNPLLTLNNSNAVLTIGNSFALNAPFPGSIALLKFSATVPTAEQSIFMYEQEKQLFRPGALSVLPDSSSIVDLSYDEATDRWVSVSASNESYWTGLVRSSVTPVPAGSYSRIATASGVELTARATTNPGVDVTIPPYGLREELVKRAESASRLSKQISIYDFVGGFTASTTNGSTAITSVANLTYPTSYIGARISGSGIPANTTITGVSGTTIYISAPATATATGVTISFLDFILPVGMESKIVMSAGLIRREGSTQDYTRLYDGFKETIRFATAPGNTAWVQIQATRSQ